MLFVCVFYDTVCVCVGGVWSLLLARVNKGVVFQRHFTGEGLTIVEPLSSWC